MSYLDRPADPVKGKVVYAKYCASCHGGQVEGALAANGLEWTYPPLYGKDSYNIGAGLYRLSSFAGFVKANMPYGVTYENPVLTNMEAISMEAISTVAISMMPVLRRLQSSIFLLLLR